MMNLAVALMRKSNSHERTCLKCACSATKCIEYVCLARRTINALRCAILYNEWNEDLVREASYMMGVTHLKMGEVREAIINYSRCIELSNPRKRFNGLWMRAHCHRMVRDHERAYIDYKLCSALEPGSERVALALGDTCFSAGLYSRAIGHYLKCDRNPSTILRICASYEMLKNRRGCAKRHIEAHSGGAQIPKQCDDGSRVTRSAPWPKKKWRDAWTATKTHELPDESRVAEQENWKKLPIKKRVRS